MYNYVYIIDISINHNKNQKNNKSHKNVIIKNVKSILI